MVSGILLMVLGPAVGALIMLVPEWLDRARPTREGIIWGLRGAGIVTALAGLVFGAGILTDARDSAAYDRALREGGPAPRVTHVVPASAPAVTVPHERGDIPIVGYHDNGVHGELSYLMPAAVDARPGKLDGTLAGGCEVVPTITGPDGGVATVGLRLVWSNPDGMYAADVDATCTVGTVWAPMSTLDLPQIPSGATVLTNGLVVDADGSVLMTAAPGNEIPGIAAQ